MPRSGRPKIAPQKRKSAFLSIRFTEAERKALDRKAAKAGKTTRDWAREHLLS